MGLKYRRFGAVALTGGLIMSMAGAGAALAVDPQADDIVFDGVVKALWVDRTDGLMGDASVRVFFYREGDEFPGILPGTFTTNSRGLAVITGVPRAIEGAEPVLLDIRADLSTATQDEQGCTTYRDWIAQKRGIKSRELMLLLLQTTSRHESVNCQFE